MSHLIVDIHPHVISSDDEQYPKKPLGGVRSNWSKVRSSPWEQLDEQMKRALVAKAAVVQSSTTYGHDNTYLADCVDSARDRITGVCSVGFVEDSAVEDIKYWIDERGMAGLRLFTTGSTMAQSDWLNDPRTMPAWSYAADNGIPVCVQLRASALPMLHNVLSKYSQLRVILDHVGMTDFVEGPPYKSAEPVYEMARHPGVYLKVTTRTLRSAGQSDGGTAAVLRELIARFGSERMAWGSNWPASDGGLTDLVSLLLDAVNDIPEADAANICGLTALGLYPQLA